MKTKPLTGCAFLVIFIFVLGHSAAEMPSLPKPDYPLAGDRGVAKWEAMWGTAAPVAAGTGIVRLPCNFQGTTFERATWDAAIRLDLVACRGLQFQCYVPETASPVSHYSFYLESGKGWYSTTFSPEKKGVWNTIQIEKTATKIEGSPAGWGAIDRLRVSAWRGGGAVSELCIANLGLLGADAPIVIVRGESAAKRTPSEADSISQFAQGMGQMLDDLGLPYAVMADLDVNAEHLKGKKIAILPHNPSMPEAVSAELVRFVEGGGKILSCYVLNPALARATGIRTGSHVDGAAKGKFASIRPCNQGLAGMPALTIQHSWGLTHAEPLPGQGSVAAMWFNEAGASTGEPAIIATDRAVHVTHVMLSDDPANKRQLLLAMLGRLVPGLWSESAGKRIDAIGRFGPYNGLDEAIKGLRASAAGGLARESLEQAERLAGEARALSESKDYPQALARATEARQAMLKAYCAAQSPAAGEHRAWWCHSAFGVAGMEWDEAIKTLADNGFTAILPNMLWGGVAYYKSDVLPVAAEVAEQGDQIEKCLAACKKYGVQCHIWKVNWNMGSRTPKEFSARMRREGRAQVSFTGEPVDWLCPSHPANRQLEIDAMCEVASKYDVDGIHFDYIRYPGKDGCFCPGCRERFEGTLGRKVANWPADVRKDAALEQQWNDFRRANITAVVRGVAERVHKERPKVKISAAVFRNWVVDRDGVGQDWKLWCERGWVDFLCPMDYATSPATFENQIREQVAWAGKVPVYPGIGLSTWDSQRDVVKLIEFIGITRRLGTGGFTVFNYEPAAARDEVPMCGLGITRPRKEKE